MGSRLLGFLSHTRTPLTILAGAILGVGVMLLYLEFSPPSGQYDDSDIRALADERIAEITPEPPREPAIYAMVRPSVVLISRDRLESNLEFPRSGGLGSGVVVDLDGTILTSNHVVGDDDNVSVRFFDGSISDGTVTQRLPEKDLAVVAVDRLPDGVEPATLGGGAAQGDAVMAIGSPFGLEGSVSSGIVSALGRSFIVEETGQELHDMIQFDAAVNPGNSGGPLVDRNGHVVGIVTGILNPTNSRVFIGIGFAVPIQEASGLVVPVG